MNPHTPTPTRKNRAPIPCRVEPLVIPLEGTHATVISAVAPLSERHPISRVHESRGCSHISDNLYICGVYYRETANGLGTVIDLTDTSLTPSIISSIVENISSIETNIYLVSSRGLSKGPAVAIACLMSRGCDYSSAFERVNTARGGIDLSLNDAISLEAIYGTTDSIISMD